MGQRYRHLQEGRDRGGVAHGRPRTYLGTIVRLVVHKLTRNSSSSGRQLLLSRCLVLQKAVSNKTKAKKEKIFLEIDAPIRKPTENTRGGRGGRGGARGGRGEGRGRGAARGTTTRGPRQAAPAVTDASAFPALA